ncbi:MAG: hypothetical protein J6K77_04100 [Ruminococcus sp.]|nr:hypothetical protein [Ruminococcus sp.]
MNPKTVQWTVFGEGTLCKRERPLINLLSVRKKAERNLPFTIRKDLSAFLILQKKEKEARSHEQALTKNKIIKMCRTKERRQQNE